MLLLEVKSLFNKSSLFSTTNTLIMGKRRAAFRQNKNNAKVLKSEPNPGEDTRKPYEDIIKENEKFITYYKTVGICKEDEWDEFLKFLKSDLPTTFRITGSRGVARKMVNIVQGEFLKDLISQHKNYETSIFPLPWYPDNLAWQMNLTKKDIRREEAFYKLHNFLITETENGSISRQETVSMIPPIVLDVKPHHKVLDMCAAPGSKTAQLIEMLHGDDVAIPSGYVVANDVDNKRCYMLVHQAKRLNSPCLSVINHDSAILPNLNASMPDGSIQQVQFDRILCDVPCSGDGTLRKNPDIWMKWTPANGINLHGVQSRILRRGCELLKVGGRIVYSTCSLNPLENEAVIHRLLSETEGALKLIDVSQSLPGLKYSKGMEEWIVGSRNLEFYKSWDEVPENWRTTIRPQMFPPKLEDRIKYNLDRCIRILPHQQNTGAFFVAVLEKLNPISTKERSFKTKGEDESKKIEEDRLPQNQRKRRRKAVFREDPFVFFKEDEAVWPDIKNFYNISNDFDHRCLLVRCSSGKKKNIYLTSPAVRDLVLQNNGTIKFINTGVKLFVRSDNRNMKRCPFRIANDGLESIFDSIGDGRKIHIPKDDLINLLLNDTPEKSPPIDSLSEGLQADVKKIDAGSCVLIYTENNKDGNDFVLHLSGWRGTSSLRVYMAQCSTVHLLRLLGGDTSKYDKNKFEKAKEESENAAEEKEAEKQ